MHSIKSPQAEEVEEVTWSEMTEAGLWREGEAGEEERTEGEKEDRATISNSSPYYLKKLIDILDPV